MTGITFDRVGVAYRGHDVIHSLSLEARAGEWVTVIGPNGAGKSTLLSAAARLVPSTGSIAIGGVDVAAMSHSELARTLAIVPQSPVIPDGTSVLDYVLLGRHPHISYWGTETTDDVAVVREELARLDLTAMADRRIDSLSGGERQRAVLARALAQRPAVLLLDEPTTGLDLGHAQRFLSSVDVLRRRLGIAVITAMHDLTLAAQYGDAIVMLADGRTVASGTADEVLTAERIRHHYDADVAVLTDDDGTVVVVPRRRSSSADG